MCPATFLLKSRAVPAFTFNDDFNRANAAVANGWLNGDGTLATEGNWTIDNNALRFNNGTISAGNVDGILVPLMRDFGTAVQDFSVDILLSNVQGMFWGYVDGQNTWYFRTDADGVTVYLRHLLNNVRTAQTIVVAGGNLGRYRVQYDGAGNTILTVPSGVKHTMSGPAHAGTKAGLISGNSQSRAFDNFQAPGGQLAAMGTWITPSTGDEAKFTESTVNGQTGWTFTTTYYLTPKGNNVYDIYGSQVISAYTANDYNTTFPYELTLYSSGNVVKASIPVVNGGGKHEATLLNVTVDPGDYIFIRNVNTSITGCSRVVLPA